MRLNIPCFPAHAFQALGILSVKALAFASLAVLGACTSVPVKEFGSYRDTFDKARAAGEVVLTDYSAALSEHRALKAARKPEQAQRPSTFAPSGTGPDGSALDYIAVRYQAWEVVAKYNTALASLAEGKSAAEVSGAVDGLVNSLSQSPFSEAKDFAAGLAPFLDSLKVVLAEAEKEAARQRFLAALRKGLPLIKDELLALLRKDTQLMSEVRFGLNDLKYERALDKVNDSRRAFDLLTNSLAPSDGIRQMRTEVDAAIARLPGDTGRKPPLRPTSGAAGTTAVTPAMHAQLDSQRTEVLGNVDNALRINEELTAYHAVLGSYVALLNKMAGSIANLQRAAEKGQGDAPPSDELLKAVIALRQTYLSYVEKK